MSSVQEKEEEGREVEKGKKKAKMVMDEKAVALVVVVARVMVMKEKAVALVLVMARVVTAVVHLQFLQLSLHAFL